MASIYITSTHNHIIAMKYEKIFDFVLGKGHYQSIVKTGLFHDHLDEGYFRDTYIFKAMTTPQQQDMIRELIHKTQFPNFRIEEAC